MLNSRQILEQRTVENTPKFSFPFRGIFEWLFNLTAPNIANLIPLFFMTSQAALLGYERSHITKNRPIAIFVSLCKQIKDLLKLTNLDKQLYIFSSFVCWGYCFRSNFEIRSH